MSPGSIITYPAIAYGLRDGSYVMDVPDLDISVSGEDFVSVMEKADEVITGIILFRSLRKLPLPVASRDLKPKNIWKHSTWFKTLVAVSDRHYTVEECRNV